MPSSACRNKTCARSEEHTSELQSHDNLVCRLLLKKKKKKQGNRKRVQSVRLCRLRGQRVVTVPVECVSHVSRGRLCFCLSALLKFLFFFFNDTATTEIYTLSLHDALPIFVAAQSEPNVESQLNLAIRSD